MSFDPLAPHYRWMETVLAGPLLQRCRATHLAAVSNAREVLVLGPGRGRFVRALLEAAPDAQLTLVDSSARMLACLRRDLHRLMPAALPRVRLVHADARAWEPPGTFDLVATHFFLDCFDPADLQVVVDRVADWTRPGSRWVVSDFQVPDHGWRRVRARAVHALMYAFFRVTTRISATHVTPPDPLLERAGFRLDGRTTSNFGLLHADLWSKVR
ncbi:MAG: class I SAM-dependent methyltransferase [Vicinamibacterales bacterium]